jgi:ABC-2 type transport system ATP-binding protein
VSATATDISAAPLLKATALSYSYGQYQALKDVSLEIHPAELVALVGRNGAGKSTLLRCLGGWTRVEDGEIGIMGLSLMEAEREIRQHIVMVPDVPPFYEGLTAWEHMRFFGQAHHLANWQERGEELLRRFGLWSNRRAFPFTFSRGMRYKMALCIVMMVAPRLALLDEPFSPLDPVAAGNLWDDLMEYSEQDKSVLLSSHLLPVGAEPDRYIVMEMGQIIAQGTPGEIAATYALPEEFSLATLLEVAIRDWEATHRDG